MNTHSITQTSRINFTVLVVLLAMTLVSFGTATDWTFAYREFDGTFFLMLELCLISAIKAGLILHFYMELREAPLMAQLIAYSMLVILCALILLMPDILAALLS